MKVYDILNEGAIDTSSAKQLARQISRDDSFDLPDWENMCKEYGGYNYVFPEIIIKAVLDRIGYATWYYNNIGNYSKRFINWIIAQSGMYVFDLTDDRRYPLTFALAQQMFKSAEFWECRIDPWDDDEKGNIAVQILLRCSDDDAINLVIQQLGYYIELADFTLCNTPEYCPILLTLLKKPSTIKHKELYDNLIKIVYKTDPIRVKKEILRGDTIRKRQ